MHISIIDVGTGELKSSNGLPGQWQYGARVTVVNSGNNELHFGMQYQFLGITGSSMNLQFKWLSADQRYTHNPFNYIDKSDAAPNARFIDLFFFLNSSQRSTK